MSGAIRHVFGNGTLKLAFKIAVPIFLAGMAWGTLWAKVNSLETRMVEGFTSVNKLIEVAMK